MSHFVAIYEDPKEEVIEKKRSLLVVNKVTNRGTIKKPVEYEIVRGDITIKNERHPMYNRRFIILCRAY